MKTLREKLVKAGFRVISNTTKDFVAALLGEEVYVFKSKEELEKHVKSHRESLIKQPYAVYENGKTAEPNWPPEAISKDDKFVPISKGW